MEFPIKLFHCLGEYFILLIFFNSFVFVRFGGSAGPTTPEASNKKVEIENSGRTFSYFGHNSAGWGAFGLIISMNKNTYVRYILSKVGVHRVRFSGFWVFSYLGIFGSAGPIFISKF